MSEGAAPASSPGPQSTGSGAPSQSSNTPSSPSSSSSSLPPTQAGMQPQKTDPVNNTQAPQGKPELYEVRANNKTLKLTLDELRQRASLATAADERFQSAAKMMKQVEGLTSKLKNPDQVIQALMDPSLGLSKEQVRSSFEKWYASEFIDAEQNKDGTPLTPEQRELREYKAKVQAFEEEKKKLAEQDVTRQREEMVAQSREELQKTLIDALETGKLPKTNFTLRRLAYWVERNQQNGFDAPIDVLVGQVKNEAKYLREMAEASEGEQLVELLGDTILKKLRSYDLEQLRKMRATPQQDTRQIQTQATPQRTEKISSSEVNRRLKNLQKTGRY